MGYARRRHGRQLRLDGTPYVEHPLEVAELLEGIGASDELITAALLHDVLEKTSASEDELDALFGPRVTALVVAVTDDDSIIDWRRRKAASRALLRRDGDDEMLALFAADKISRIRELRRAPALPPSPPTSRERRAHYHACLHMIASRLPGSPLLPVLRAEIESFDHALASASAAATAASRSR